MKLKQSVVTLAAAAVFAVMTVVLVFGVVRSNRASVDVDRANENRAASRALALELAGASSRLTNEVRSFAVTTDEPHLAAYWKEVDETKTRERVIAELKKRGATERELGLMMAGVTDAKVAPQARVAAEGSTT